MNVPHYDLIVVRYGEIGLKGRNRPAFEDQLLRSIRMAFQGWPDYRVRKEYGRMIVQLPEGTHAEDPALIDALERLTSIFGIVSVSPAVGVPLDLEAIKAGAHRLMGAMVDYRPIRPSTFKVETRRSNKRFPMKSPELNGAIGAHILKSDLGLTVDVHAPDVTLLVEVRDTAVYMYTDTLQGPGGLPVGSSSRALLLLSGGIDSPVAGWFAMKRGIRLEAIHFQSPPFTSERAKEKVLDLAEVLSRFAGESIPVHLVHFTDIQQAIRTNVPDSMGITIMRRMMVRIATQLAEERRIPALVTGESVGQVASQTLESMQTINAVTTMPILRPLVAMDKEEIVDHSQRIGTYDISIQPYDDCCTLFVPKRPETKPRRSRAEKAEAALDVDSLIAQAIEQTTLITVGGREGS